VPLVWNSLAEADERAVVLRKSGGGLQLRVGRGSQTRPYALTKDVWIGGHRARRSPLHQCPLVGRVLRAALLCRLTAVGRVTPFLTKPHQNLLCGGAPTLSHRGSALSSTLVADAAPA
jgi:hypothetical protein